MEEFDSDVEEIKWYIYFYQRFDKDVFYYTKKCLYFLIIDGIKSLHHVKIEQRSHIEEIDIEEFYIIDKKIFIIKEVKIIYYSIKKKEN